MQQAIFTMNGLEKQDYAIIVPRAGIHEHSRKKEVRSSRRKK
jgi:hypothetical protein